MNAIKLLQSAFKNKGVWFPASRYFVLDIQLLAFIFLSVQRGAYYVGIWSFILLLVSTGTNCNWGIDNTLNILLAMGKSGKTCS